MILMRETTPLTMRFGTRAASCSTPSMRKRIRISPSSRSKWMSEAPSVTAWPRMLLTSLITGASSADRADVGDLGRLARLLLLVLGDRLGDGALQRAQLADQRVDVARRGDRDPAVEPGRHLHVVEREHVGGVRHRQQQRLLVDEADRHGLVAAGGLDRDHVGRAPCRPGRRRGRRSRARSARPSPGARRSESITPCSSSTCSGGLPGGARLLDRGLDLLGRGEAEVDDHVGDEAARVSAPLGRDQAQGSLLGCGGVAGGRACGRCRGGPRGPGVAAGVPPDGGGRRGRLGRGGGGRRRFGRRRRLAAAPAAARARAAVGRGGPVRARARGRQSQPESPAPGRGAGSREAPAGSWPRASAGVVGHVVAAV